MTMKVRSLIVFGALIAFLGIPTAAHAVWVCDSGGKAKCFVNRVDLYTTDGGPGATDTYILARIADPSDRTTCSTIRVRKGAGNASIHTIKMAQAMLMMALKTQFPIKFTLAADSDSTNCTVDSIHVQNPRY